MRAIELEAEIDQDRKLQVQLPATVTARKARVIVLYDETAAEPSAVATENLKDFLTGLNDGDWPKRTIAEIDQQIAEERDSWERD